MAKAAPASRPSEPKVGARLRTIRRERGLTIEQVAEASGLTRGFISQLERDTTAPSLSSLARICDVLAIRIGDVFHETDDEAAQVVRRDNRTAVSWNPNHFLLTSPREMRLQAIESHIEPGGSSGRDPYSFPGDVELVYVVSGSLELTIAEERYLLEQGDALTYPLREQHSWRNPSRKKKAVVLWIATPNPYSSE